GFYYRWDQQSPVGGCDGVHTADLCERPPDEFVHRFLHDDRLRQVLDDGLYERERSHENGLAGLEGTLPRAFHGQVRCVRQTSRRGGGPVEGLLHDGRPGEQDPGDSGTFHGDRQEQGCRGAGGKAPVPGVRREPCPCDEIGRPVEADVRGLPGEPTPLHGSHQRHQLQTRGTNRLHERSQGCPG
ncbi:unnamed protein product, partial [Cyprideis torosa]